MYPRDFDLGPWGTIDSASRSREPPFLAAPAPETVMTEEYGRYVPADPRALVTVAPPAPHPPPSAPATASDLHTLRSLQRQRRREWSNSSSSTPIAHPIASSSSGQSVAPPHDHASDVSTLSGFAGTPAHPLPRAEPQLSPPILYPDDYPVARPPPRDRDRFSPSSHQFDYHDYFRSIASSVPDVSQIPHRSSTSTNPSAFFFPPGPPRSYPPSSTPSSTPSFPTFSPLPFNQPPPGPHAVDVVNVPPLSSRADPTTMLSSYPFLLPLAPTCASTTPPTVATMPHAAPLAEEPAIMNPSLSLLNFHHLPPPPLHPPHPPVPSSFDSTGAGRDICRHDEPDQLVREDAQTLVPFPSVGATRSPQSTEVRQVNIRRDQVDRHGKTELQPERGGQGEEGEGDEEEDLWEILQRAAKVRERHFSGQVPNPLGVTHPARARNHRPRSSGGGGGRRDRPQGPGGGRRVRVRGETSRSASGLVGKGGEEGHDDEGNDEEGNDERDSGVSDESGRDGSHDEDDDDDDDYGQDDVKGAQGWRARDWRIVKNATGKKIVGFELRVHCPDCETLASRTEEVELDQRRGEQRRPRRDQRVARIVLRNLGQKLLSQLESIDRQEQGQVTLDEDETIKSRGAGSRVRGGGGKTQRSHRSRSTTTTATTTTSIDHSNSSRPSPSFPFESSFDSGHPTPSDLLATPHGFMEGWASIDELGFRGIAGPEIDGPGFGGPGGLAYTAFTASPKLASSSPASSSTTTAGTLSTSVAWAQTSRKSETTTRRNLRRHADGTPILPEELGIQVTRARCLVCARITHDRRGQDTTTAQRISDDTARTSLADNGDEQFGDEQKATTKERGYEDTLSAAIDRFERLSLTAKVAVTDKSRLSRSPEVQHDDNSNPPRLLLNLLKRADMDDDDSGGKKGRDWERLVHLEEDKLKPTTTTTEARDLLKCDVCNLLCGISSIDYNEIRENGLSSSADPAPGRAGQNASRPFTVEVICARCDALFKACSDCGGGGGRLTPGKWRCKELFPDGRKNCQLSHARNPTLNEITIVVSPVSSLSAAELDEASAACRRLFFNTRLGTLCRPDFMLRGDGLASSFKQAENLSIDYWGRLEDVLRGDLSPESSMKRYLCITYSQPRPRHPPKSQRQQPMTAQTASAGSRTGGRRVKREEEEDEEDFDDEYDLAEPKPAPSRSRSARGATAGSKDGQNVGKMVPWAFSIVEVDFSVGVLFFCCVIPWATSGQSFDANSLLIERTNERVKSDLAAINLGRRSEGLEPYPRLRYNFIVSPFRLDSKNSQNLNRRGYYTLDQLDEMDDPDSPRGHGVDRTLFPPYRKIWLPAHYAKAMHVFVRKLENEQDMGGPPPQNAPRKRKKKTIASL